jgi:hypothetical protein
VDETSNLLLPYILAAQAQKHVTHNEALRKLDALVQISVVDRDLAAPPASTAEGARYIIAASPTGAWTGHADKLAAWQDGAWAIYPPRKGWLAWVEDEGAPVAWNGTAWVTIGGSGSVNPVPLVGINATADTTNRLAIASAASMFNHSGAGHQLKINKIWLADATNAPISTLLIRLSVFLIVYARVMMAYLTRNWFASLRTARAMTTATPSTLPSSKLNSAGAQRKRSKLGLRRLWRGISPTNRGGCPCVCAATAVSGLAFPQCLRLTAFPIECWPEQPS